ncbi:hypothetical protein H1R20_g1347, partial [Candolleomyces eurysporus]
MATSSKRQTPLRRFSAFIRPRAQAVGVGGTDASETDVARIPSAQNASRVLPSLFKRSWGKARRRDTQQLASVASPVSEELRRSSSPHNELRDQSVSGIACDEELPVQLSSREELSAVDALTLGVSPTSAGSSAAIATTSFFANSRHFSIDRFTQIQATNVTLTGNTASAVVEARGAGEEDGSVVRLQVGRYEIVLRPSMASRIQDAVHRATKLTDRLAKLMNLVGKDLTAT